MSYVFLTIAVLLYLYDRKCLMVKIENLSGSIADLKGGSWTDDYENTQIHQPPPDDLCIDSQGPVNFRWIRRR